MKACKVSTACVRAGGPLKPARMIRAKSSSVWVSERLAVASPSAAAEALVPFEAASPHRRRNKDQRAHQAARAGIARKTETLRRKQKLQQAVFKPTSLLLIEIGKRDETIAALQAELAKERLATAAMAAANWQDGVDCGQRGWGPTPSTPGRAARASRVAPA